MSNSKLDTGALPEQLTFHVVEERRLSIDEIDTLQYQPRSVQSEPDQSLYESIKQVGLQSPLVVAQIPNEKRYVPIAGGNSRLQVLSRLYSETRDKSFANVQCVVSEWPGLARARLAHVITNQVRIRHSFASKAIAIVHIVDSERSSKELRSMSQREAVQLLTTNGYPISQSTYCHMEYLVRRLRPSITIELLDALRIIDVRELREIEHHERELWQDQNELNADFNEVFMLVLEECAAESSDVEHLVGQFRHKLSSLRERSSPKPLEFDDLVSSEESDSDASISLQNQTGRSGRVEEGASSDVATKLQSGSRDDSNLSQRNSILPSYTAGITKRKDSVQPTIGELRETAWNLASHLCNSFDMDKCIIKRSNLFGYQIASKPNCDPSAIQHRLWNYLDAFAGSGDRLLDVNVWSELNDDDWRAMIELWDVVRVIRKNRRTGAPFLPSNHDAA